MRSLNQYEIESVSGGKAKNVKTIIKDVTYVSGACAAFGTMIGGPAIGAAAAVAGAALMTTYDLAYDVGSAINSGINSYVNYYSSHSSTGWYWC